MKLKYLLLGAALCNLFTAISPVFGQGTAFVYNGFLNEGQNPANGSYVLTFALFDASTGGQQVGSTLTKSATAVNNGLFTVTLDFGPNFTGPERWLEIAVQPSGPGSEVVLSPRQAISPTPYAIMANSASNLLGTLPATQLDGSLPMSQVSGTLALAQLPASVVLNNSSGVSLNGTFTGNGAGVSNVNLITVNSQGAIRWTPNFSGAFATASSPPVESGPISVVAADVNGDGKPDLISANSAADTLSVLINNGSGGFVLAASQTVGDNPSSVEATDVNGDSKLDLISANFGTGGGGNTLSVLINDGTGQFMLSSSPIVGNGPFGLTAADLNGDGKPDLISANSTDNTLSVMINNGSGTFALASSPLVGATPRSVAATDVNGDGKVDLISANIDANTLSVLINDGSGTFALASSPPVGAAPRLVIATDVNGDGRPDLISANQTANRLSVLINNGSGTFALASSPSVGSFPRSVTAADVNGDGEMDLISANYNGGTLSVLTNNGSGGFALTSLPIVGNGPISVVAADVNADGRVDLVSANFIASTLTVLTNTPTSLRAPAFFEGAFVGNGADLINLNAASLTGSVPTASLTTVPASSLIGTLDDARLSANAARLDVSQTIMADWINAAHPWADDEVANNLTLAGGAINDTPVGQTTAAAGTFTTLNASDNLTVNGDVTLGNAPTSTLTINAGSVSLPHSINATRALVFGNGDNKANFYSSAADTLKTDGALVVKGSLSVDGAISGSVAKLGSASSSTTPSVRNLTVLVLATYPAPTFITDLTDGVDGQVIVLVGGMNSGSVVLTVKDNDTPPLAPASHFKLKSNVDWIAEPDATLTVCRVNGFWLEMSRSDN